MSSDELNKLIKQIEELRNEIHLLSENKKLTDPEILVASQMLDVVLNEFNRLLKRKQEENE